MRSFFLLTYQAYAKELQSVVDYSMGRFDSAKLRIGIPLCDKVPGDVHLVLDEGQVSDLLANPLSWLIMSKKLYAICKTFSGQDMEVVGVPIIDQKKELVTDYLVINLLRTIRAVDMQQSHVTELDILGKKIPHVMTFVFRGEAIPDNIHLFRPEESMSHVIVSQELVSAFKGLVTGVSLIMTRTV